MTLEEQEAIVIYARTNKTVSIYTTNPAHMRRIRKDDRFTVTREHLEDGVIVGLDATIPADQFNPLGGIKRRVKPLSDAQRAELSVRFGRSAPVTSS